MVTSFFVLAAQSPGRQLAFRRAVVAHILAVGAMALALTWTMPSPVPGMFLGQVLLVLAILEGATLLGWRLAQLPKSQALEFLLVSPLRPGWFFLAEVAVGVARIGLVTLAGLPLLALLAALGLLAPLDLLPLLLLPFTWAVITGLALIIWAYEPLRVRRWGERGMLLLVLLYLVVGVLAGEKLRSWLMLLPDAIGYPLFRLFRGFHFYNPFGMLKTYLEGGAAECWEALLWLEGGSVLLAGLLLWRGATRLLAHFHERHYSPAVDLRPGKRGEIANQPLTWWAVRRVSQYRGQINLWLAGGFCVLYALYTLAGQHWPAWMGRGVFVLCDRVAGIGGLATALVVLAAVPAAFQYGLWDANAQERCRRLELLLLTRLGARDYWNAAAAAAWQRGRGYFFVALLLLGAAALGGQLGAGQVLAAAASGVLLWSLYFALGFRAFSRGAQTNGLGIMLTVGLPVAACVLGRLGVPTLAQLLPPGGVYGAAYGTPAGVWVLGPLLAAMLTFWVARRSLHQCERELRRWYDQHHGQKVMT